MSFEDIKKLCEYKNFKNNPANIMKIGGELVLFPMMKKVRYLCPACIMFKPSNSNKEKEKILHGYAFSNYHANHTNKCAYYANWIGAATDAPLANAGEPPVLRTIESVASVLAPAIAPPVASLPKKTNENQDDASDDESVAPPASKNRKFDDESYVDDDDDNEPKKKKAKKATKATKTRRKVILGKF